MKARFNTRQNIIGLETDNIVQKSSELVNLGFDVDLRSGIELNKINVTIYFVFEALIGLFECRNKVFLLEDF